MAFGWFIAPAQVNLDSIVEMANGGGTTFATTVLSVFLVMNVFLCAFNLLPLPPLDGSAILEGILPDQHAMKLREFQSNAVMSMVGLLIAWKVFPFITDPLFVLLLRLVHPHDSYS